MKKIILTIFLIILFATLFAKYAFTAQDSQNSLKKISENYNKYLTITSNFKQTDSNGEKNYGFIIFDKKNNKARIEYTSKQLRIIINNNSIMIEQVDLQEKTFLPLTSSPFKYIISDNPFNKVDLNITNINSSKESTTVSISSKNKQFSGSIMLMFNKYYYLSGWVILDELGNKTTITLLNTNYNNNNLPSSIFNTHRVSKVDFKSINQ